MTTEACRRAVVAELSTLLDQPYLDRYPRRTILLRIEAILNRARVHDMSVDEVGAWKLSIKELVRDA